MARKNTKAMYAAEAIGTFIVVFASLGASVANVTSAGQLGLFGVAAASGFAVLIVCYTLGHISGAHVNPAVTIGFASQKRFPMNLVVPYIIAQLAGAVAACFFIYILFGNVTNFEVLQPAYPWPMVFLIEFTITFILMLVIMGVATDPRAADPAAAGKSQIGHNEILLTDEDLLVTEINGLFQDHDLVDRIPIVIEKREDRK